MLEVKDINLFYGAAQALRGVSIAAEPGKVTCVLGRNGVGKTSLLRSLVGQYPIAIDLIFHRRFLKLPRPGIVAKHFQQIVGAEITRLGFCRMRDLQVGLDAVDILIANQFQRTAFIEQFSRQRDARQR